ncbi:cellulose biosynthesis protein BcsN [Labrenzia sp. 011]|uniref:cellulose biosynthesis protein BcsN n=1 Tax=Labrenzia sp. 011 TaxID=2171494 RepID=UPI001403D865|nr:cellulose biosynthesis protein BcsN [Labrenzia sp. 011]
MRRLLLASVLAISLAACAKSPKVESLSSANTVPISEAFATPPPGGPAIVGIIETAFTNGKQQDIALATQGKTPGQNLLRVQLIGVTSNAIANGGSLSEASPSQEEVSREIAKFLPGVNVKRSPYFLQNHYGPFSYAAGRSSAGDICIYAWQRIGKPQSRKTIFSTRGAIQIRLRLCDPKMSEQELLEKMYGISINVAVLDPMWDPYGAPAQPPAGWGRPGDPISPRSSEGFIGVVPAMVAPRKSQPRPARPAAPKPAVVESVPPVPAVEAADEDNIKSTFGVVVPPPPSDIMESGKAAADQTDEKASPVLQQQ